MTSLPYLKSSFSIPYVVIFKEYIRDDTQTWVLYFL